MNKYTALICARGGSKGVPGKNIKNLCGRPLLGWAVQTALQIERISRVLVSTDSAEIAAIARQQGAEVPFFRPPELARDDSPEWPVWQHALAFLRDNGEDELSGMVVLPTTAPLRSVVDVQRCLDAYEQGDVDVVITVSEAHRSPYFNMVTHDDLGYARLVIDPGRKIFRRQDVPTVYDMTTVAYVARPGFVMTADKIFAGRVRSVVVPAERALDIDTAFDFQLAELLMAQRLEEMP